MYGLENALNASSTSTRLSSPARELFIFDHFGQLLSATPSHTDMWTESLLKRTHRSSDGVYMRWGCSKHRDAILAKGKKCNNLF